MSKTKWMALLEHHIDGRAKYLTSLQNSNSYCQYGKKKHIMMDIFGNPQKPFCLFSDIAFLSKNRKEDMVSFLLD